MPISTAPLTDYTGIIGSTYQKYTQTKEYKDNIFNSFVLFQQIRSKGKLFDGGESILVPLMYSRSTDVQTYSGYGSFTVVPQEPFGAAIYTMKEYICTVAISEREKAQNRGANQILNLLQQKIRHSQLSLKDRFESDLFAGNASDSTRILGLVQHVATTGTVGGIAKASNTFWQAQSVTFSDFNGALGTGDAYSKLTTLYNNCTKGGGGTDVPTLAITDLTSFGVFEGLHTPNLRYYLNTKMADAGFLNIMFKQVPLVFSSQATANKLYMINANNTYLMTHSDYDFRADPMVSLEAVGQTAWAGLIKWKGEFVCDRQDRNGIGNDTNT